MIAHAVFDEALACVIREASRLDICSGQPATMADVAKLSLGHKTVPQMSGPVDVPGGRAAVVGAIENGQVTGKGNATYWCLSGNGRLLACEPLGNRDRIALVPGIAFTLPSIHVALVNPN